MKVTIQNNIFSFMDECSIWILMRFDSLTLHFFGSQNFFYLSCQSFRLRLISPFQWLTFQQTQLLKPKELEMNSWQKLIRTELTSAPLYNFKTKQIIDEMKIRDIELWSLRKQKNNSTGNLTKRFRTNLRRKASFRRWLNFELVLQINCSNHATSIRKFLRWEIIWGILSKFLGWDFWRGCHL